ncbi:MAG: hypothetical protein ACYDIA_16765 [Candidatus Humimicrobiaceae bacterium]
MVSKKSYPVTEDEKARKMAINGNQVWKNPRLSIKEIPNPKISNRGG